MFEVDAGGCIYRKYVIRRGFGRDSSFQNHRKPNSSLDGRVTSYAEVIPNPRVPFLPILGLETRNAGPCLFIHLLM